jgi:cell division protein FtsA
MAGNHFVAGIDIGTEKIALLVAEREDDDHLRIFAYNVCPSSGVERGSISSIDSLSREITQLIKKTEESFDLDLIRVRVNISDTHLTCKDNSSRLHIDEKVKSEDVESVVDSASAITTSTNKQEIHTIKKKFTINEEAEVDDPMDMEANVLEAKVHIITVSSSSVRNIENCLKQSNLEVDEIVLNTLAKSQAVLTREQKNSGVCLLDIGAGVTSYSVFQEEGIVQSGIIAMGGDDVTQEIAYAFDTSLDEAKRLKENYGAAKSLSPSEDRFIDFIQANKKEECQLSSIDLSDVIEESYREIFELLKNELKHRNLDKIIKSGFVLCGGGSEINSIEELIRNFFSKRVKLATIQRSRISGLEAILTDYRYTGSIGLLLHESDLNKRKSIVSNHKNGFFNKLKVNF